MSREQFGAGLSDAKGRRSAPRSETGEQVFDPAIERCRSATYSNHSELTVRTHQAKVVGLLLAPAAFAIAIDPTHAPLALIVVLVVSARPLIEAWQAVRGTALRPALVWALLALALAVVAQAVALAEPLALGRPLAERFTYLCVLALLAALGSVLNARTPGGKAWACLMMLMVVVFLIPWLEDQTRLPARRSPQLPSRRALVDLLWTAGRRGRDKLSAHAIWARRGWHSPSLFILEFLGAYHPWALPPAAAL